MEIPNREPPNREPLNHAQKLIREGTHEELTRLLGNHSKAGQTVCR